MHIIIDIRVKIYYLWRNYFLLNMSSDKMGGEHVMLIHMIDSVTYDSKYASTVTKSETTTLQLELHHPYSL